jgi:leukotriene-A4 hydrolase
VLGAAPRPPIFSSGVALEIDPGPDTISRRRLRPAIGGSIGMHTTMSLGAAWLAVFVLVLAAVTPAAAADDPNAPPRRANERDWHSYGNPEQIRVFQVFLELEVDFEERVLKGAATLDFTRQPGCPADAPLIVDTRGLAIEQVGQRKLEFTPRPFVPARYRQGPADPVLGAPLSIDLDPSAMQVRIAYRTSPSAGALQWLSPALTAGKTHPFLFTQSQAIQARTWIPLQDSPAVRVTFVANIKVPKGLKAVMAAESRVRADRASEGFFEYVMPQPIPSYLIALAVGDLAFQSLGKRTGVWAEPAVLKKAADEFADVEAMIAAVEARFGWYRWGRYDILVLPPSFPFGGMENPKLTFATPTILAGDRSLVSLIAHELAHSWSGNLVTNATWRDFWLNEGFTTYLERRIIEEVYGADRADMEAVLGLAELRDELKEYPPRDQILHIDLKGRDPDDGVTRIPYEKGALFVRALEEMFGRDRFDGFLREYFDHFTFQSITTAQFRTYLHQRLLGPDPDPRIDLDAWLEQPGLPARFAEPKSTRLNAIDRAAKGWLDGSVPTANLETKDWSTQEWLRFLHDMPERLPVDRMAQLDRAFQLTTRGNAEIAHQWLLLAIRGNYTAADGRLEDYLLTIGRRKLIVPLYRALVATPGGKARAQAIYAKARPGYHPIAVDSIDRLMKESGKR